MPTEYIFLTYVNYKSGMDNKTEDKPILLLTFLWYINTNMKYLDNCSFMKKRCGFANKPGGCEYRALAVWSISNKVETAKLFNVRN